MRVAGTGGAGDDASGVALEGFDLTARHNLTIALSVRVLPHVLTSANNEDNLAPALGQQALFAQGDFGERCGLFCLLDFPADRLACHLGGNTTNGTRPFVELPSGPLGLAAAPAHDQANPTNPTKPRRDKRKINGNGHRACDCHHRSALPWPARQF